MGQTGGIRALIDRESGVQPAARPVPRATRFVSASSRANTIAGDRAAHHAIVTIDPIAPSSRGRLLETIEDACDALLASLGSAPAGMGAFGSPEGRIGDRLFRANRVGKVGLTIALGSLRPLARSGALAPEDADALRALAQFAIDRPVSLLLDEDDASLGAFRDPIPLASFLDSSLSLSPVPVPVPVPELAPVSALVTSCAPPDVLQEGREIGSSGREESPHPNLPISPPPCRILRDDEGSAVPVPVPVPVPAEAPPTEHVFLPIENPPARVASRAATVAPREHPWRAHATALTTARGPQPLGEFERLFARHYVPLTTAILEGLDDPRARAAAEEFRHTFARSYAEAFPTFVVTGKRPRLVLDAPDLAGRAARLHGARTVQLLLVDAMRWDLGMLVRDALLVGLGPRATLADEGFLLAALPSTTHRQLAGIARGVDGLRSSMLGDPEGEALRGRTSEVVRRLRVGSRDLYKLDLVDARLREADGNAADLFPEIARRVSDAIVRHAQTLPPRTLLYVFGDHGFSIDAAGAVHQGGASPEEVLTPAFSFLLGMMQ